VSTEILFFIASAACVLVFTWSAWSYGKDYGFKKGRDEGIAIGWNEHREECVARDRARRQRNGQFKAKIPQPQTTRKP
jgi:hypothetical protein